MKEKILVIDDEVKLLEVIKSYLEAEGFEVYTSLRGAEGVRLIGELAPSLIILDLMLPDIRGEAVCKKIREDCDTPIIMLTAKTTESDRINGLSLGADDYLTKPFSPRELVLRVKAILRRTAGDNAKRTEQDILIYNNGDLRIDDTRHLVFKAGAEIAITPNEYKILLVLAKNPGRVFSREQLITAALGFDYAGYDRTIDAHIKNIRHKLETDIKNPDYILTVYGIGYKFKD